MRRCCGCTAAITTAAKRCATNATRSRTTRGARLERCVFGDAKPTCANCVVHCYRAEMRERVREMMRWAGPRMLFRHPVLAILHMADGRRPGVLLPSGAHPACLPDQSGEADS